MSKATSYFKNASLKTILWAALGIRLLASFFSKGYAFHDDHFCVVRVAQNWVYGLPHWIESPQPPKHSMLYAGFNAVFIWLSDFSGFHDPVFKTTVLRIVHALISLLVVYYGYKITALLASKKEAILTGWILALLWFMPFLGVKFLAEMVCTIPLLAGFYLILRSDNVHAHKQRTKFFLAGLLFGLAFTIRMHTVLFAGGMGLVLLYEKKFVHSLLFTLGYLLVVTVVIGVVDVVFFEYPFQYILNYFIYNAENATNYVTGSPFKFLATTLGFLVPPVSLMLVWGYIKGYKTEPKIFWAILVFFLVHSFFPNKQERFILPMFPMLIILGVVGWNRFKAKSAFWQKHIRWERGGWYFFWIVNTIAMLALALTYSKKDRVEPIYYLSQKPDVSSIIVESEKSVKHVPVYYLGQLAADYNDFEHGDIIGMNQIKENKGYLTNDFPFVFTLGGNKSIVELQSEMTAVAREPNYIIFKGADNLEKRKQRIMQLFPNAYLKQENRIEPSGFDKLLHFFNPRIHRDETAFIYKVAQGQLPTIPQ